MPSLEAYKRELDYTYAPGLFPSLEAVCKRPEWVRRVLYSKNAAGEGMEKLCALCEERGIRMEEADKALSRISGKENCFAAAVVEKRFLPLQAGRHIVLHHISDGGNLGTILRTALGFGYPDIAVIRPAVDAFEPRVIRASMGAMFSLRLREYVGFDDYRSDFPGQALYPFMLDGAKPLERAAGSAALPFTLIFGNEGAGLPGEFAQYGTAVRIPHSGEIDSLNLSVAAAIGMYRFERVGGKNEQ